MKKTLFTFLLLFAATAMNAQGIVKGDMDGDGEVTITDVTSAVDVILGKAPKQLVKPYNVDNTLIVGTWYAPDGGTSFTMNEDGTTDYPDAATYKFRYYLGTLTMYNASGKTVKVMGVVEVEKNYLLLLDYATGAVAYYYCDQSGSIDGRDYVDLGLPSGTLWATCNVGASSPEDYGDYFAWGETSAKTMYNWSTYFDTKDNGNTFNKYNNNDGLTILEPEDDAAYKNWGPAWRMPSKDQIDELINSNYTTTEWTTQNGVQGRLITSKSNGNSIFLPAAGVRTISYLVEVGSDGYYWSRTLHESDPGGAWFLGLTSNGINWGEGMRPNGFSVRPVRFAPPAGVTTVDLGLPSGTLWANMNVGASSPEDYGDYFAWGETEPYDENGKTDFGWFTYKWCNGPYDTMTKYCNNSRYGNDGFTDDKTELDPEDDAAYVNWGSDWRMPSQEQLEELFNSSYTITEWTTQNGVKGRLITSKSNGNSIFLPAASYCEDSWFHVGNGVYWSRTLYESHPNYAWGLATSSRDFGIDPVYRYLGVTVRPVCLSNQMLAD